ncbi:MAG: sulfite exporter TauE/SafE family protein [Cyanobacteria bacterium J06648_16]
MLPLLFILLGLAIGALSGLIGIGGGVLFVPALVYFFGFDQYQAQGTTMALLVPPIGILGAWTYYQQGHVDIKVALLICLGFVLGGFVGAKFAVTVPELWLKRVFGVAMLVISLRMIFSK